MNKIEKAVVFILLIACLFVGIIGLSKSQKLGVDYNSVSAFTGDVDVSGTLTTGAFTNTGATTLSGANTLSGTTTITGNGAFLHPTKTTVAVGGVNNIGCLAIGSSGSTTTVNYITANTGTLSTTTTKPTGCN